MHTRIRITVTAALLMACGGTPPPTKPVAPKPKQLADLAPQGEIRPITGKPVKKYAVAFVGDALPDADELDSVIAKLGLVVNVGTAGDTIEVEAQDAICELTLGPRLSDEVLPNPRHIMALEPHGLSETQADQLVATTATIALVCRPQGEMVTAMTVLGEVVATALESLLPGSIYDPQSGRFWPPGTMKRSTGWKSFRPERGLWVVGGQLASHGGTHHWLATRGMVAYGRPDLEVFPVRADQVDAIRSQLYFLADAIILGDAVGDGSELELGPVRALLWSRAAYAATLPPNTPGIDIEVDGATLGRLAVVDPEAAPGNIGDHERFLRRLTVR